MPKPVRIQEVTHLQYATVQRWLASADGTPESRVLTACRAAGIEPPTEFEDVKLVVVPE